MTKICYSINSHSQSMTVNHEYTLRECLCSHFLQKTTSFSMENPFFHCLGRSKSAETQCCKRPFLLDGSYFHFLSMENLAFFFSLRKRRDISTQSGKPCHFRIYRHLTLRKLLSMEESEQVSLLLFPLVMARSLSLRAKATATTPCALCKFYFILFYFIFVSLPLYSCVFMYSI